MIGIGIGALSVLIGWGALSTTASTTASTETAWPVEKLGAYSGNSMNLKLEAAKKGLAGRRTR